MVKKGKAAGQLAKAQSSQKAGLAGGAGNEGGGAVEELGVGIGSGAQEKREHQESVGAAEPALVDRFANRMVGASKAGDGKGGIGATGKRALNQNGGRGPRCLARGAAGALRAD